MYDKLIERLRANGELFQKYIPNAEGEILLQAADALEELSRENKEIMFRANQLEAMNDALIGETGATDALIVASKPRWIPVKERLPSEDGFTLIFTAHGHAGVCYFTSGWWGGYDQDGITHWMPLPEPPKEG